MDKSPKHLRKNHNDFRFLGRLVAKAVTFVLIKGIGRIKGLLQKPYLAGLREVSMNIRRSLGIRQMPLLQKYENFNLCSQELLRYGFG